MAGRFTRDQRGATALMFGLMLGVLFMAIGIAIDTARLYSISDRVRNALDASALAGAKLLDVEDASDTDITNRARAFFATYLANLQLFDASFGSLNVITNRTAGTVTVDIDVDYRTLFGKLFSITNIKFTPGAVVHYKNKKIELALVLDITGSMCDPNPRPCVSAPKLDGLKAAAASLISELAGSNPEAGAVKVGVVPYAASVNIGSYYTAATNLVPGADTCVVERGTMPGAVFDDAPGPGRWVGISSTLDNNQYSCPSGEIMPMQDIFDLTLRGQLIAHINSLEASGYTAGHIGSAWGWYMISPNWDSFWPLASRPRPAGPDVVKAVLIMTDGIFNTAYFGGNKNGDDYSVSHSSGDQALSLCQNMRNAGIIVYTVAFDAPSSAETLLSLCAGGGANAMTAANTAQLSANFREIGQRLSMLRVSR